MFHIKPNKIYTLHFIIKARDQEVKTPLKLSIKDKTQIFKKIQQNPFKRTYCMRYPSHEIYIFTTIIQAYNHLHKQP